MTATGIARFLVRHAAPCLALGVVAGLATPPLAAVLNRFLPELVMTALSVTLLRLDRRLLGTNLRRPGLSILAALWLLFGIPALTLAVCRLLPLEQPMRLALLLNAATPPIMGAPAMALILGLEAEMAAIATLSLTLLFPLTLSAWFASGVLPVDGGSAHVFAQVARLVAIPFGISGILRVTVSESRRSRWNPYLDATGVLALALTAIALMHGANTSLAAAPSQAIAPFLASLTFNVLAQGLSILLFLPWGHRRALCLGLMSGDRNLALTLGAAASLGGPRFAAYVAFAQLPIYFTPMLLARLAKIMAPRTDK